MTVLGKDGEWTNVRTADGIEGYGGLMLIGGDYYYARTSGEIVCGKTYWITKNNDLLPVANYTFDADGKMVNPPTVG